MHDPVSDFLNKLKIASKRRKPSFQFPYSRFIECVAQALADKGFLAGVAKKGKSGRTLECALVYGEDGVPKVRAGRRISRLSKRIYCSARELWPVRQGFGIALLSTPKGILSDADARKARVGGEVLFEIW